MNRTDNQSLAHEIVGDPSIAQAIVDTIDSPLLVLDRDLHVVAASRAYYRTFNADRSDTEGRHVSELGDREWDRADLLDLLAAVVAKHRAVEAFELEREVSGRGRCVMRVAAR